eukprot:scaffold195860_cov36-Tisochrysis_lutea.AAC.1
MARVPFVLRLFDTQMLSAPQRQMLSAPQSLGRLGARWPCCCSVHAGSAQAGPDGGAVVSFACMVVIMMVSAMTDRPRLESERPLLAE